MAATSFILSLLMLVVLVVLPLAVGIVLIFHSRRGGLGYPSCGKCQYNLSASVGKTDRCPECGALFVEAGVMPPRGRRKPLLLWLGIGLMILPLTCIGWFAWSTQSSLARARAAAQAARQQQLQQQQQQRQTSTNAAQPALEQSDQTTGGNPAIADPPPSQ